MKLRILLVFTATFLTTTHSSLCINTAAQATQRKTDAHVPSSMFFDKAMKAANYPLLSILDSQPLTIARIITFTLSSLVAGYVSIYKKNYKKKDIDFPIFLYIAFFPTFYLGCSLVEEPLSRVHEKYTFVQKSQEYYRYKEDNKESLPEYITATSPIMNDANIIRDKESIAHKELVSLLQPLAHHQVSKNDEGCFSCPKLHQLIPEGVTNVSKALLKMSLVDIDQINRAYELQMKNEQDAFSEILKRGTSKN
ncbi:MAG: hypothetical protein WBQ73_00565 [Candidatus Babeliales bacterium]